MIKEIVDMLGFDEALLLDHSPNGILTFAQFAEKNVEAIGFVEDKYFHDGSDSKTLALCLYMHICAFHLVLLNGKGKIVGMDLDDLWVELLIIVSLDEYPEMVQNILSIMNAHLEVQLFGNHKCYFPQYHLQMIDRIAFVEDIIANCANSKGYDLLSLMNKGIFYLGDRQQQIARNVRQLVRQRTSDVVHNKFVLVFS
jgi:hypothetical protein